VSYPWTQKKMGLLCFARVGCRWTWVGLLSPCVLFFCSSTNNKWDPNVRHLRFWSGPDLNTTVGLPHQRYTVDLRILDRRWTFGANWRTEIRQVLSLRTVLGIARNIEDWWRISLMPGMWSSRRAPPVDRAHRWLSTSTRGWGRLIWQLALLCFPYIGD
jgi:hypothetical protein